MTSFVISMDFLPALAMLGATATIASILSALIILASRSLLFRYTVVHPNARSSHTKPTPQGGGIGVIVATTIVATGVGLLFPEVLVDPRRLLSLLLCAIGLAALGFIDDISPLNTTTRMILQIVFTTVVVSALPAEMRIVPSIPWWFERACILFGCVWFINLVNFMDGIDWMTVVEFVPITIGLGIFGLIGALPRDATIVAVALLGAVIGFAPFNRPVARLFLGDVGSLPIGLMLSWLLVLLASNGHLAAALLLPLYYLADATITLVRRTIKGEPITEAHRSHFYQRATDHGYSVYQIVGTIFALNILLVVLALASIRNAGAEIATLVFGGALVGAVLWRFNSAKN